MKQDIATYLVDSFVDYAGKEHKIVACALSESPIEYDDYTLSIGWENKDHVIETDDAIYSEVYRMVTVGIAICNPSDEFNEEAGRNIARNKAANIPGLPCLYATRKGMITKELVDVFLKQQVTFFKEHPETLIPGYKEAKEKHENIQRAINEYENLTPDQKTVVDLAMNGVDVAKCANLAKIYLKNRI